ncbi:MAG: TonB-dependent receptor plug domain-containing protein [Asticcacaulis sp.]
MSKKGARFGQRNAMHVSGLALISALGMVVTGTAVAQTAPVADEPATEEIETVIVTGVMQNTKAKKANVSYSVLTEDDMNKFTPISADDMLRDIPGVVVESNDGVARNEVFTRGMTIGTGANTSGYFWSTILEDGMPTTPFKFSGFQDGYFFRADSSTSRVEAVRGGSSATAVTTSVGATFNYITSKIRPGAEIRTRVGFEGEDLHLSWKEIDGYYGWMNKVGDFGYSVNGFYRRSNGQVNPGWDLNHGGQFKVNLFKKYETDTGSGSFNVVFKHLDDTNAELTTFQQPAYGYQDPKDIDGFPRDVNLFMNGGKIKVPNARDSGTHSLDPSAGYRYQQDAVWLKWEHKTAGNWSYQGALRFNVTRYDGQSYKPQGLASLASAAATSERYGLNINGLNRTPGYYEFYDSTGTLRARVAQNVNGSQNGINYRTGAACARVTSTTTPGFCVVANTLPNSDIDVHGGVVYASDGTDRSVTYPNASGTQDLVLLTRAEDNKRGSDDIMGNFTATYTADTWSVSTGLYIAKAEQFNNNWASGTGISAWADGEVENLSARFVTTSGTTYQLTGEGGWGNYGTGLFTTVFQRARIVEVSPFIGVSWSPNEKWDLNASFKFQHYSAKTHSETYDLRNSGATSLTNGGLDGNPLTVYDNVYNVLNTAKVIDASKEVENRNYSASIGYNINTKNKVYYRYMDGRQPAMGIINRYSTEATLVRPLGPTGYVKGHEFAYTFGDRQFNGQVTLFYQNFAINDYPVGIDKDNVSTYLLPINFNKYFTRGVESWFKWKVTNNLSWDASVTYLNGRTSEAYNWLNVGANSLGADDDALRIDSGILPRSPKWTISNTLSYKWDDFRVNVRHRWMDERKVNANAVDTRWLPTQDNLDLSVQYEGIKNTRIMMDVRNVLDTSYISGYDTMVTSGLTNGVQLYDVVAQLPDSGFLLKRNAPRSVWITIQHKF